MKVPENQALPGTRVRLVASSGNSYTREVVTSTGMLTDQTPDMVFGLGSTERVDRVVISHIDGSTSIRAIRDDPFKSYFAHLLR